MDSTPYHIQALWDEFSRRQRRNSTYSLRAFSRDLMVQAPTLSAILRGKRPAPLRYGRIWAEQLELSSTRRRLFLKSFSESRGMGPLFPETVLEPAELLLEDLHFQVIAEWEHYAVLSLMETRDFCVRSEWMAKRLGISVSRARTVWRHLVALGLVRGTKDGARPTKKRLRTTENVASNALRRAHEENAELSVAKLRAVSIDERDFSSRTLAIDMANLPEAKACIRRFRDEMEQILEQGASTEVYQLAIQLFPLTKTRSRLRRRQ